MRLIIGLMLALLYVHTGCAQRILVVDEAKIREKLELAGHSIANIDTLIAEIGADHISIPTTKAVVDYVADLGGLDTAYVVGDSLFLVQGGDTLLLSLPDIHIGNSNITLTEDRVLDSDFNRLSFRNFFFEPGGTVGLGYTESFNWGNAVGDIFLPTDIGVNPSYDTTTAFIGSSYRTSNGFLGIDSYVGMTLDSAAGSTIQLPSMGYNVWLDFGQKTFAGNSQHLTPVGIFGWFKDTDNFVRKGQINNGAGVIIISSEQVDFDSPLDTTGYRIHVDPDSLTIGVSKTYINNEFKYETALKVGLDKSITAPGYDSGSTITGTLNRVAGFDASGKIIPVHPDSVGGGGGITLDTVLVQSDTLVDWNSKNFKVVQLDMTSVTSITLEFANPTDPLFGTLHFRNVSGTDAVTFPGNVYWMDETSVGTLNITQGTKFTIIYDGTNYYME